VHAFLVLASAVFRSSFVFLSLLSSSVLLLLSSSALLLFPLWCCFFCCSLLLFFRPLCCSASSVLFCSSFLFLPSSLFCPSSALLFCSSPVSSSLLSCCAPLLFDFNLFSCDLSLLPPAYDLCFSSLSCSNSAPTLWTPLQVVPKLEALILPGAGPRADLGPLLVNAGQLGPAKLDVFS